MYVNPFLVGALAGAAVLLFLLILVALTINLGKNRRDKS